MFIPGKSSCKVPNLYQDKLRMSFTSRVNVARLVLVESDADIEGREADRSVDFGERFGNVLLF